MNSLDNVKVGDKLLVLFPHDVKGIETVERITATLVITKHHRFIKKSGKAQGSDGWTYTYAKLATPEDAEMIDLRNSIDDVFRNGYTIKMAIGKLIHDPTGYSIAVYKPISRFKRLMLRLCFGLKFEKI